MKLPLDNECVSFARSYITHNPSFLSWFSLRGVYLFVVYELKLCSKFVLGKTYHIHAPYFDRSVWFVHMLFDDHEWIRQNKIWIRTFKNNENEKEMKIKVQSSCLRCKVNDCCIFSYGLSIVHSINFFIPSTVCYIYLSLREYMDYFVA